MSDLWMGVGIGFLSAYLISVPVALIWGIPTINRYAPGCCCEEVDGD